MARLFANVICSPLMFLAIIPLRIVGWKLRIAAVRISGERHGHSSWGIYARRKHCTQHTSPKLKSSLSPFEFELGNILQLCLEEERAILVKGTRLKIQGRRPVVELLL